MANNNKLTIPYGQYDLGKKKYNIDKNIIVDSGEKGYKQLAAYLKTIFDNIDISDITNIVTKAKNKSTERQDDNLDEMSKMLAGIFKTKKSEIKKALKETIDLSGKTEKKISKLFAKKVEEVKSKNEEVVKKVEEAGKTVVDTTNKTAETISKTLDESVKKNKDTAKNTVDTVKNAIGTGKTTKSTGGGKGSGKGSGKSGTKTKKTKDSLSTTADSVDKLGKTIDEANAEAKATIEKKVDSTVKEIKQDSKATTEKVVNAIDVVKKASTKANKESVILAGKYNLTSKNSVDIPKNIKISSATSKDELKKYLESLSKDGHKVTDNQIKTLKSEAKKRLAELNKNGTNVDTILKDAVCLSDIGKETKKTKATTTTSKTTSSKTKTKKTSSNTDDAVKKLAEATVKADSEVKKQVDTTVSEAKASIEKAKQKSVDEAKKLKQTIISAGKYNLVGGRKNGTVNIEKDLIISSGDKGISELQEYLMTVVTGANKVTKTQTKNLRTESNNRLADRISSLSSDGSDSTDVKNKIYSNAIPYDRAIKDWFAKEMTEIDNPSTNVTTANTNTTQTNNSKILSKDEKKMYTNRYKELKSVKNGQQLSFGIPVAKKPNNSTPVVEEVKVEDTNMAVEEPTSPIGPQGTLSFGNNKVSNYNSMSKEALKRLYKAEEEAYRINQQYDAAKKAKAEQTNVEKANIGNATTKKVNKKTSTKTPNVKSIKNETDKIVEMEANKTANVTEEEKNIGEVSRASTSYSFAKIKQAMDSLKDTNTLEPNRRIDNYHIKEYDEIADVKKRERAQKDVKSSTASNYIGGPGAVTSREVINGMLHRADPKIDEATRQTIMDKERHRLDLEYAPQSYIEKLETFTKTSVEDPNFLEKTYELRNKNKEIGKEMNDMHGKIQKNFENVHTRRLEERNKELANVKYGIHVGSVVTPGKNQNGKGKTTKAPILFRSEKELEDYLRSINPSANQATLDKIKEKVMKEYNDDFKNVYKNEIDAGRNIYGLDSDLARKDVHFNDLMKADESAMSTQFEKIKNYSGASDEIITKALIESEDKAIASEENVQKVREDNIKNNAKKSNEEDRKEEQRSKKRQKNKAYETTLQQLYNEAIKKNVDLQKLGEKALKHQKEVHEDILKINKKINDLNRKEAQRKKQYVDILMDEQATYEQKLVAEQKLKEIGKFYKAQRAPYNESLKQKNAELEQNKELLDQGIRNHLKSRGAKEEDINKLMDSATRPRRGGAGGSGGSGGNGGSGGIYVNGGDIIFPVSQNTVDENKSRLATMYNDFTSIYGKIRTGMYMFSQFSASIEGLAKIEEAVYDLGVVGQLSTVEISSLRKELLYTATQGRYTTIELAESAADIVRTGRSFEESMEILKQSQILATASFDNVRNSTNTLIKAMTAFNLNASSAAHAANSFHNVVNATPLDLKTFDDSLRQTSAAFGSIVYFSSKSGTALEEYKKEVVDTTAVLTGLQAILG